MIRFRKWPVLVAVILVLALLAGGCSKPSSDSVQQEQSEQILAEGTRKVGMPNITNFFERETLKKILEMRDDPDLVTYSYGYSAMTGKYVYIGRSIGYGIPFSTQFTNPEKVHRIYSGTYMSLPQADPNGLFSSGSTSATWIILVNEKTNEIEVLYMEPPLTVSQTKLPRRIVEEWSLPADY